MPKQRKCKCLIVRHIPDYTREDDLRLVFDKYGQLDHVSLPRHRNSRMVRGIACLEYDSPVQASEAMCDMQGKELVSRMISINYIGVSQTRDEVRRRRASRKSSYRHGNRRPYNDNLEQRRSYSCNRSSSWPILLVNWVIGPGLIRQLQDTERSAMFRHTIPIPSHHVHGQTI